MDEKNSIREKFLKFENILNSSNQNREQLIIILRTAQSIFG